MPPILTYAASNLWNYEAINSEHSIEDPANFRALTMFTRTEDENWFNALPAAIEMRGRHVIPLALQAFQAAQEGATVTLEKYLLQISQHIQGMTELLPRMYERNAPQTFYTQIRPFLAGTVSAETPNGVFYENDPGGGELIRAGGPTAAQSPLFPFLDEALGISHSSSKSPGQFLQVGLNHRNLLIRPNAYFATEGSTILHAASKVSLVCTCERQHPWLRRIESRQTRPGGCL